MSTEQKSQQIIASRNATTENKQPSTVAHPCERQFMLNANIIKVLQENPEFKKNITVGKVFKVIQAFIEEDESAVDVARRFEMDEAMAGLIKSCIK